MVGLYIFLIAFFALTVFTFISAYFIFAKISIRRKPRKDEVSAIFSQNKIEIAGESAMRQNLDWVQKGNHKKICITSEDGLRLCATLIDAPKDESPKGVIIAFHGYRSFGARDFCFQLPMLHKAGYHIMLIDQRAHGDSEGKYICYGVKEHKDALLWREKAREIYGNEIPMALFGLSMGGATVLMASGEIDHADAQIKCVVADCPFYDSYTIIKHVLWKYYKVYPTPIIYFINFWSRFLADFNMRSPTCADKAKKSNLPTLILHGKEDVFVPTECSIRLANELGDRARLVLFENAKHAESIYYGKELYESEVLGFLAKYMQ